MISSHTLDVRAFYERFGLVSERKEREPEDHIGLEMEFMSCLCDRHGECLRKGDAEKASVTVQAQRDFLDEHLLQWVLRFCEAVDRFAWTDFFRGMAQLTEGFVAWDRRFLGEPERCGLGYIRETGL